MAKPKEGDFSMNIAFLISHTLILFTLLFIAGTMFQPVAAKAYRKAAAVKIVIGEWWLAASLILFVCWMAIFVG